MTDNLLFFDFISNSRYFSYDISLRYMFIACFSNWQYEYNYDFHYNFISILFFRTNLQGLEDEVYY